MVAEAGPGGSRLRRRGSSARAAALRRRDRALGRGDRGQLALLREADPRPEALLSETRDVLLARLRAQLSRLLVHVDRPLRHREDLAQHGLEALQRQRVVLRVEAVLVVLRAERGALAEERMIAIAIPNIESEIIRASGIERTD